jgi:redox-sensitive bicupin YhaK (pirin superfamily)
LHRDTDADGRGDAHGERMITIRPSDERGAADHGWLSSKHTFSFAGYHDPRHMGFRSLRVLNEDRVAPRGGFPTHGHREMEIVSYVIEGALAHRDSTGTGSTLRPGDVQRMTAGTGVHHSEENPSREHDVHFLQIWIQPDTLRLAPGYEQKHFDEASRADRLRLVGSRDGRDGSITIHQDLALYAGLLGAGARVEHAIAKGRHAWIQVVRGTILVNGETLRGGDGAAISDETKLVIESTTPSELLLFDLA